MRSVFPVIAIVAALGLSACGAAAQSSKPLASSRVASVATPTAPVSSATATPVSPANIVDAASLATELAGVEQAIRIPDTPTEEYVVLGQRQQQAYHLLAAHRDWVGAVLGSIPAPLRAVVQDNLSAAQQIDDLNGARTTLPHWRIIQPPTSDVLLGSVVRAPFRSSICWAADR